MKKSNKMVNELFNDTDIGVEICSVCARDAGCSKPCIQFNKIERLIVEFASSLLDAKSVSESEAKKILKVK